MDLSRAKDVSRARKKPARPQPRTTLSPLTGGKLYTAILKIITANPTVKANKKSRKNCLLGWDGSGEESTKEYCNGWRKAKATRKAVRMIAPKVTGGKVSRKGQTCPPYRVRTEVAKK